MLSLGNRGDSCRHTEGGGVQADNSRQCAGGNLLLLQQPGRTGESGGRTGENGGRTGESRVSNQGGVVRVGGRTGESRVSNQGGVVRVGGGLVRAGLATREEW